MPTFIGHTWDIALTITLNGLNHLTSDEQHEKTIPLILDRLKHCKHTTVTELTKNYDIHYHSIISIPLDRLKNQPIEYYLRNILRHRNLGFICVKPVKEYDIWTAYIMKTYITTNGLLKRFPVIKDDYGLLSILTSIQRSDNTIEIKTVRAE